jgi:hypothetical protein
MTNGIDCSRFAALLADLLAEPPAAASDPRAVMLREHAERCPDCAASADLVALAATPARDRDPIDDPGDAYWDAFGRRLNARLSARRVRFVGLAAAAGAAVAIVWLGLPRHVEVPIARPTPAPVPFPSATVTSPETVDDAGVTEEDASAAFGATEPLDAYADDDAAGLFPATDELSPAEAERFLRWLEEEEARVKRGAT